MRLPKKVDLGLSVIHVVQVNATDMRQFADAEGDEATPDGLWDPDADTIYLLKTLPTKMKRRVYYHELKHAINDNDYWDLVD